MTRNKKDCQGSTRINKIAKRYLKIRYLKIKAAEMRVTSDILQCPTVTLSAHAPWAALEMILRYLKIKAAEMRVTSDILQCPTVTLSAHAPWAAPEKM